MPADGKKMIFDRIQWTENCIGDLCTEVSSFTKKKARLRDKYDDLSLVLKNYGGAVRFNDTLSNGLLNYSNALSLLGDVKDIEVQRLQLKVVRELAGYENICKNARDTMKHSLMLQGKEMARKHHIQQIKQKTQRQNGASQDNLNQEPIEDNNSSIRDFEDKATQFERQKITDIRQILLDLTMIQLKECAKSMEILSAVYNDIAAIDVDKDSEEFSQKCFSRNSLKPNNRSQSLIELNTNNNNHSTLKRSKLFNSSVALSSPTHPPDEAKNESKSETSSKSESEEEIDSESEEETSSDATNQTSKPSSDDDDDVEIRPTKTLQNKRSSIQEKRNAPTPQVRFSKLNNGRK